MFLRAFMPWLHLDSTFALSSLGRLQRKCLKVLHGMTTGVIRRRKEQILNSREMESQQTDPDSTGMKKPAHNGKIIKDSSSELLNWKVVVSDQTLWLQYKSLTPKHVLLSHS
jgi:hypothetical protein